jgi:hypothetical protein
MSADKINPGRSRKIILILGLAVLTTVTVYAYYTTKQFLIEKAEQGEIITSQAVARELAAIAMDFLMKTIERYKGG